MSPPQFGEQLQLFNLGPRDQGQGRVGWADGGLQSLKVRRFKAFSEYEIDFDRLTLMVGANSSGKTSLLQAIRLFFWCVEECGRPGTELAEFKKAVMPFNEFSVIPAHELKELVNKGVTPNRKEIGIELHGELAGGRLLSFRIYAAYSILMAVEPIDPTPEFMPLPEYQAISRRPLYIPGFFGVVTQELLATDARLEQLLRSGHHNEVLRNLVLRLSSDSERMTRLRQLLEREFEIKALEVPFSQSETDYLRAAYREPRNRIPLDFVSAGAGFLQVLQILAHALQNPSPILLLDEPDAHMHSALQRSFLQLLREFVTDEEIQVVMASHSETLLREMQLGEIRVIDRTRSAAAKFPNAAVLEERLSEAGIWPDHLELAEILRTRRVLLMEGREDEESLDRLGRKLDANWDSRRKLLQVVLTEGSSDATVARLQYVNQVLLDILPDELQIAHVRDRDLLTDAGIEELIEGAEQEDLRITISERRNREAYLVEPDVVERALRHHHLDSIPDKFKNVGAVAQLVHEIILDWCREHVDRLPSRIHQYNSTWIRRRFDSQELETAQTHVTRFVRREWTEPIQAGNIPWKLVDGKDVLSLVRIRIQKWGVVLPEAEIHSIMEPHDYGKSLNSVARLVQEWTG